MSHNELDRIIKSKIINNNKVYDARELKKIIGIRKDYSNWIKSKLTHYKKTFLNEYEVYSLSDEPMCYSYKVNATQGCGVKIEYYVTYKCLCDIIHNSKKTPQLEPILNIIGNNHTILKNREEIEFVNALKETLKPLNISIKEQYYCSPYRIDIYIKKYNLAIEFDETHHKYQIANDINRENYLKEKLNCTFIRCLNTNSIYYNIGLVMKEIFKNVEI